MNEEREGPMIEGQFEDAQPTGPVAVQPAAGVVKAIIATKIAIGVLTKDENNPFHKYKYVPIDAYYQHVASKAAENGLTWRTNLVGLDIFSEGTDDRGRTTSILRFQFSVDLFYVDGTIFQAWQNIIILHPVQGAQTTGSALSYAEKLFMRTTFSVTTAEDDTDSKNTDFQPKVIARPGPPVRGGPPVRPPAPVKATPTLAELEAVVATKVDVQDDPSLTDLPRGEHDNHPALSDMARELVREMDTTTDTPILMSGETLDGKYDTVAEIMVQFLGFCRDQTMLETFWKNNVAAVKQLQKADPGQYNRAVDAFKARRAELVVA